MRYRQAFFFVIVAAIGLAACGGHAQITPQVPPNGSLQTINPTQDHAVVAAQTQAMTTAKRRLKAAMAISAPPTPGCDMEGGVANCNVYVGTHFDWNQTINNTDGGASALSVCSNIVFDPMPGDANASVQAIPQPIPAIGPCGSVNAPFIWRITGKQPKWLDLTAGVTYYTIGVDSGTGRWHWNLGFIVSVWAMPTPTPCAPGTPGPDPTKPILLVDANGNPILNADGQKVYRPDDGLDPQFFISEGLLFKGLGQIFGNPLTNLEPLPLFKQGGPWDEQRINGTFYPHFVDYATITIGLYGAASGTPESLVLEIENLYAWRNSQYKPTDPTSFYDTTYTNIPRVNVFNTNLGYNLYNSKAFALCSSS